MNHNIIFSPTHCQNHPCLHSIKQELYRILRTLHKQTQQLTNAYTHQINSLQQQLASKDQEIESLKHQIASSTKIQSFSLSETPLKMLFTPNTHKIPHNRKEENHHKRILVDKIIERVSLSPKKYPFRKQKLNMGEKTHQTHKTNDSSTQSSENKINSCKDLQEKENHEGKIYNEGSVMFKKIKQISFIEQNKPEKQNKNISAPNSRPKLCRKPSVKQKKFLFQKRDSSNLKYNKNIKETILAKMSKQKDCLTLR